MNIPFIVLSIIVIGLFVALIVDVWKQIQIDKIKYLENDLSRDYARWTPSDIAVAAYIGLFAPKEVRLDDHFQAVTYGVLKRSDRAVDEKIRRISTIGSRKSDASVADEDAAFLVLSYEKEVAKKMFVLDLRVSGASKKQIETLMSYL